MKVLNNQSRYWSILFLTLVSAAALGQSASSMHGIKVISPSRFDPQTHTVKLTLINDSKTNITAWGYCVRDEPPPGERLHHGYCTLVDPLVTVIWYKIESAKRPYLPEPDCPRCRPIHPGQELTLSQEFPSETVNASIEITLIAYEGGRVESTLENDDPRSVLPELTASRSVDLRYRRSWIDMGRQILADADDQHPASTMITKLASDPNNSSILREFKRPEHNRGNQTEFIPADERSYLQQFVSDQERWAVELAKNQVVGGAQ